MKKIIILSLILTSIPVFASCPIDSDGAACSIAQFQREEFVPIYSPKGGIKEFSATPEARLNPAKVDAPEKELRKFRQQETDYSYNSSCQFGVCNQTGAPQLFPTKTK